ncbi:uncharacterized protein LOC122281317 [Carya illinoinensis]|uniref:uncharacterized protein LOC122281317 n=1 Tax=Carya illinoinensis TaxID=32201 RepID=UPI001C718A0A|nr:uncharacterized protein LOC122281317 [Carya illinoinensis]
MSQNQGLEVEPPPSLMNCMGWNCRGLGNSQTIHELYLLVKAKSPDLIFLIEIKCSRDRMEFIRNKLGFDNCFTVNSRGRSGGLAFLWSSNIEFNISTYTSWHISATIKLPSDKAPWLITGFYGHPNTTKRSETWLLLREFVLTTNVPWLCFGDFNEITIIDEKHGVAHRPYRNGEQFTKERLDRALGNTACLDKFEYHSVLHLTAASSDHRPIMVQVKINQGTLKRVRPFRFCQEGLKIWSMEMRRSQGALIKEKLSILSSLKETNEGHLYTEIKILQKEVDLLLETEKSKWQERAKQNWLRGRDRNTSFFHKCASQRRKQNPICNIRDIAGNETTNQKEISQIFQISFFQELFTSSSPKGIAKLTGTMPRKINTEMSTTLARPFTTAEVKKALFNMNPLGSPGPDDFPTLKLVLPAIISPTQIAFVPGRLITDNIIVAFESLHTMKARLKGRDGFMALKLDMSKAYDRIEWPFLKSVLHQVGLDQKWVNLIMRCVESVSYSFIFNGTPQDTFYPTRGLRQGDPLSPYLFILCSEVLSCMLNKAESSGLITGLPIRRKSLSINHLFFVDNNLLFCKANPVEWSRLYNLLKVYELASSQRLNKDKTSIYFSKNTKEEAKAFITSIAGIRGTSSYEKYLGLPALIGKSRAQSFKGILDKLKKAKSQGGLGLRDFSNFNLALLAKQGWRVVNNPDSLAAKVLKEKYFSNSSFLSTKLGQNSSYLWQSFLAARSLLKEGLVWRIGDGAFTEIWNDRWLLRELIYRTPISVRFLQADTKVSNLISGSTNQWKRDLIYAMFTKEEAEYIIAIPLSPYPKPDKRMWKCTTSGEFSVKSAYHLLPEMDEQLCGQSSTPSPSKPLWTKVWNLKVSNATKTFLWRACLNGIPTRDNLVKRKAVEDPACPVCSVQPETVEHILWSCPSARDVWSLSSRKL